MNPPVDTNPAAGADDDRSRASSADLTSVLAAIVEAVREVHDGWEQDEHGEDPVLGFGGNCDAMADAIAGIVNGLPGATATTQYVEIDTHTVAMASLADGIFMIDIPARTYEIGYGYVWTKIRDVVFTPDDVVVTKLSDDPNALHEFVEGMEPNRDEADASLSMGP